MAKLIDYKVNNGGYNMRLDIETFEEAIKEHEKEPVIRFYGWSPECVSLGRNQSLEHINTDYCRENNIDIVKRITGGRGLLHDNEVTYSFVCPIEFINTGQNVIASYKEISSAIILGFKNIDIDLEFRGKKKSEISNLPAHSHDYCMLLSTSADLSYNGLKLIGSAQYRSRGYILQHGSVLFNYNKQKIEKIFNEKFQTSSITCINQINTSITKNDVINAMKTGFKDYFDLSLNPNFAV